MQTYLQSSEDALINSAEQRRLAGGVCSMTLLRWERAGIIPPAIKIRGRNYRRRGEFMAALDAAAEPSDRISHC